jgi:hypothetical protein
MRHPSFGTIWRIEPLAKSDYDNDHEYEVLSGIFPEH